MFLKGKCIKPNTIPAIVGHANIIIVYVFQAAKQVFLQLLLAQSSYVSPVHVIETASNICFFPIYLYTISTIVEKASGIYWSRNAYIIFIAFEKASNI